MEDLKNPNQGARLLLGAEQPPFLRQLLVATLGLLFVFLVIHLLREFQVIFQPLFIAVFLGYLILPVHKWLVRHRVPGILAIVVILTLILGSLFGLGMIIYANLDAMIGRMPAYEEKLDGLIQDSLESLPFDVPDAGKFRLRAFMKSVDQKERAIFALRAAAGTFFDFFTGMAIAFVYLIFLVAEKVTFPRRLELAFGSTQGTRVLNIIGTINQAIGEYLMVKTFISFLAGAFSLAVLWFFGVDFFVMWSILIFLLNFIPSLGSLVAVAFPIFLSLVQFGDFGKSLGLTVSLIAVQVVLGNWVEPRMAGRRLGVSPLLILLSLSFWGMLWGIVGMILSVPLLVIIKIVLENIKATRPMALLMSNL